MRSNRLIERKKVYENQKLSAKNEEQTESKSEEAQQWRQKGKVNANAKK